MGSGGAQPVIGTACAYQVLHVLVARRSAVGSSSEQFGWVLGDVLLVVSFPLPYRPRSFRFVETDGRGFDRVRNVEIGKKYFKLTHFEEVGSLA